MLVGRCRALIERMKRIFARAGLGGHWRDYEKDQRGRAYPQVHIPFTRSMFNRNARESRA